MYQNRITKLHSRAAIQETVSSKVLSTRVEIDLAWYGSQIREHGPIAATYLLCRELYSRAIIGLSNRFLPATVVCPCCGWKGSRFDDYIEVAYTCRNAACPQCDSHPRHRALYLWLNQGNWLQEKRGVGLVFAAEEALAPLWDSASLRIFRIDIKATRRADFVADLTQLPIGGDSIDVLWCHHVLEHIEDDRAAIRELHRTMRPATGELVVSVPMKGAITREYGQANRKESGHWRMYGDDFVDRLEQSGFTVEAISPNLSPGDFERFGLIREQYYLCKKLMTGAKPASF